MDVLTAAWTGAGAPGPGPAAAPGGCARCAAEADLVPARTAISKVFTGYDDWASPSGAGLCPACAWGYATPALRSYIHAVTDRPPMLRRLDRAQAHRLLAAAPMRPGIALLVPLRPGRKHLLPAAVWGRVTVDDVRLPWTAADAQRLQLVARLRGQGFGTRMLREPAPPFPVLRRLPVDQWATVMNSWSELDPWRTQPAPWLELALHITAAHPEKEQP